MGLRATNAEERRKIERLKLSSDEWERVGLFLQLLSHADSRQQLVSSETEPCLHAVLPALEGLHRAWSVRAEKTQYEPFAHALNVACDKISEYYNKTENTDAYVVSICTSHLHSV